MKTKIINKYWTGNHIITVDSEEEEEGTSVLTIETPTALGYPRAQITLTEDARLKLIKALQNVKGREKHA